MKSLELVPKYLRKIVQVELYVNFNLTHVEARVLLTQQDSNPKEIYNSTFLHIYLWVL